MTNSNASCPLVVDLDGTLIRSDLLVESFCALLSQAPLTALKTLKFLQRGRAAFKAAVASHSVIDVTTLPYNAPLLAWLKAEHARGRPLYIASASHASYVQAVADHLGLFTGIFASDGITNLRSTAKARVLCDAFGDKQFDYVGNDSADLAVWEHAAQVIVTGASPSFVATVQARFAGATVIASPAPTPADYRAALRPHQWLKNLLVFVPALAAHTFDIGSLVTCALAFVSFSLCASSGYVLNDLLDAQHDRTHHTKRNRPFAAGRIGLRDGARLQAASLAAAIFIALFLPATFLLVLAFYYALTLVYSSVIKRQMMLDVITLSLLYGVRLVAGGVALGVALSPWLLSFASFFFLSLALIKRCSELVARQTLGHGDPAGRSYRLSDLPMLEAMAAAAGYVAALTSGLYINSDNVTELYSNPAFLWAVPMVLLFWISRMLLLTHRGDMLDDPLLFAVRDRTSVICGALIMLVLLVSI